MSSVPPQSSPMGSGGTASPPVAGQQLGMQRPAARQPIAPQKVPKLPQSQFAQTGGPPQIQVEPLRQPDTFVTIERCLEQLHRVLTELAEKQEDPVWCQQHIDLAEAWRQTAEMLLNHAVAGHQAQGDIELKQQQLEQQHELHQQTLSFNDQKHVTDMKHTDAQHKQQMKQGDDQHRMGLQQQSQKFKTQQVMDRQRVAQQKKSSKPSR